MRSLLRLLMLSLPLAATFAAASPHAPSLASGELFPAPPAGGSPWTGFSRGADQASIPQATIILLDDSFDAPENIPAGTVTVVFQNQGSKAAGAQLFRLNPDTTLDAVAVAVQNAGRNPDAERDLFVSVGGPAGIAPGASEQLAVTMSEGQYIVTNILDHFDKDFLVQLPTSGALPYFPPPGTGQVPPFLPQVGGQLPFRPIFYTPFRVSGPAAATHELPTGTPVSMSDFSYDLPPTLPAGQNVFYVTNTGQEIHEMAIGKIADGASLDDVIARFQDVSQPKTFGDVVTTFPNANVDSVNGLSSLSPGLSATVSLDFPPGRYVVACFIPGPNGALPHVTLGMIAGFEAGAP